MGLEVPPPSSEQASWGAAFQNPLEPASPTICKLWGPASQPATSTTHLPSLQEPPGPWGVAPGKLPWWPKEPACQCRGWRRSRFDPWVGRIPGGEDDNPLQHSCQGNPMDRGAWWAAACGSQRIGHA